MTIWISFWGIVILFSIISFSFMSAKVIIKGYSEMKDMFKNLLGDNN